jgi:hypothetical protein
MAEEAGRRKRAAVVVLGDIGRSPRIQYHSLSLANQVIRNLVSVFDRHAACVFTITLFLTSGRNFES